MKSIYFVPNLGSRDEGTIVIAINVFGVLALPKISVKISQAKECIPFHIHESTSRAFLPCLVGAIRKWRSLLSVVKFHLLQGL